MSRGSQYDNEGIDAQLAANYPVSRASLRTMEIERAQNDVATAVVSVSRSPRRAERWRWSLRPRRLMLLGAVSVGFGGSLAAAATLLSAHTGYFPTRSGLPVSMGGPGEELNAAAPDFCRASLEATSAVPFPARYATWRQQIIGRELQIKSVTTNIPCSSAAGGRVTTGWLNRWVASSAFCGWVQAWAVDRGAGNYAGAAHDAEVIRQALSWKAIRWNDPHPDGAQAGDASAGTRTKTPFGWLLAYQQAVRSNDRATVETLLAGTEGFGECQNFDLDLVHFTEQHLVGSSITNSDSANLLLKHLQSEGV